MATLQSGIDAPPPPTICFLTNAYQDILIANSQPYPKLSGESNSWSDILPTVCCFEKC